MQCHEWYTTNLVYAEMHSRLYLTEKLQLNLDNNVPISHADVTKLDGELISREDHTNEFDIISIK